MSTKGTLRKIFSPLIWGHFFLIILACVLLFFVMRACLGWFTHHGSKIEMPDVTSKPGHPITSADAIYLLEAQGLEPVIVDSAYNKNLPAGIILTQKPAAGSFVKVGRRVELTINTKNAPLTPVPDLAGNCSVREAQDRLKLLGFRVGEPESVPGDKDWVYGIKYNGRRVYVGEKVPSDAILHLLVGKDSYVEEFEGFTDTLAEEAIEQLEEATTESEATEP